MPRPLRLPFGYPLVPVESRPPGADRRDKNASLWQRMRHGGWQSPLKPLRQGADALQADAPSRPPRRTVTFATTQEVFEYEADPPYELHDPDLIAAALENPSEVQLQALIQRGCDPTRLAAKALFRLPFEQSGTELAYILQTRLIQLMGHPGCDFQELSRNAARHPYLIDAALEYPDSSLLNRLIEVGFPRAGLVKAAVDKLGTLTASAPIEPLMRQLQALQSPVVDGPSRPARDRRI
jgi:hypothetical protein